MKNVIDVLPAVATALENNQPVVALESTIISHGMPWPTNVEMAEKVEAIIASEGAVPATIAIIDGRIKVGLDDALLRRLAKDKSVIKASKRDIAYLIATKQSGATTVSATTLIADLVGIHVFATGGIGGVHREAEQTFDVSRDLDELAACSVAVICAGAKSILDIPKTLEYLETRGVEVIGYQTDQMPKFYSRTGTSLVDYRLDAPAQIAELMRSKWALNLKGGVVIANPIPADASLDKVYIDTIIETALASAKTEGITGKALTPYLLEKIEEKTGGKSLEANLALVYNNARLAAKIASAFASPLPPTPRK